VASRTAGEVHHCARHPNRDDDNIENVRDHTTILRVDAMNMEGRLGRNPMAREPHSRVSSRPWKLLPNQHSDEKPARWNRAQGWTLGDQGPLSNGRTAPERYDAECDAVLRPQESTARPRAALEVHGVDGHPEQLRVVKRPRRSTAVHTWASGSGPLRNGKR